MFFGFGPAIFADGSTKERIITACVTILLIFGLGVATRGALEMFPKISKKKDSKEENTESKND